MPKVPNPGHIPKGISRSDYSKAMQDIYARARRDPNYRKAVEFENGSKKGFATLDYHEQVKAANTKNPVAAERNMAANKFGGSKSSGSRSKSRGRGGIGKVGLLFFGPALYIGVAIALLQLLQRTLENMQADEAAGARAAERHTPDG